mgnify:CR=1 FL=1
MRRILLSLHGFSLVATTVAAFRQGNQLALDELLAKGRDMVDEHLPVEVVELMLHDARQIALDPFVVVLELLVVPLHMDARRTHNLLMDAR